ncbi:MAG TPA: PRC-barrel domain-containing protein [Isosphaeraceae bacterium]
MQRMMATTIACSLVLALGSAGVTAQQPSAPGGGARPDLGEIRKVSSLLDVDVLNRANEEIAGIEDLVLSTDGRVLYAVLSRGGVADIGAESTAVPWEVLNVRHVNGKWAVNLDMTEEALEKAPTFQQDDYKELTNPQWVARVHDFYRPQTAVDGQPGREPRAQALQSVVCAAKIVGANLKNAANEDIGEVKDLLLDRTGRMAFAILGHGGTLGIGESFVPVPWSKLRLNYNREDTAITVQIPVTKEQLEKAPLVKEDTYATLLAPGFVDQVYRYFGMNGPEPGTGR